jgi:transcriptional regulator with XRE-family HTH domain
MTGESITFGRAVRKARKDKGWNLRDVASRILREDGQSISPQYLNDIEHARRSPFSDHMVQQFSAALDIDCDWLYYLVGRFPEDVRLQRLSEIEVVQRMAAFRGGRPKARITK